MKDDIREAALFKVLSLLPNGIKRELVEITRTHRGFSDKLFELRLRAEGRSFLHFSGGSMPLYFRLGKKELEELLMRLCHGAIYAYRDTLSLGYISLGEGVRVGVAGHARYESGHLVGVNDVSSLVIRIPSGECAFAEEIYRKWYSCGGGGMLICSLPAGGKTTLLRSLCRHIGTGDAAMRVAVIDERCEFIRSQYENSSVELIRGYKRSEGIELAIRTMAPEVIAADEISTEEDKEATLAALGAGVSLIATAHAGSIDEAMHRGVLRLLFEENTFRSIVFVKREGNNFSYSMRELKEAVTV